MRRNAKISLYEIEHGLGESVDVLVRKLLELDIHVSTLILLLLYCLDYDTKKSKNAYLINLRVMTSYREWLSGAVIGKKDVW